MQEKSSNEILFSDALTTDKPSAELGDHASMYQWLIGGWAVKAVDYLSDGSVMETAGEWYFSWVLEGRAVQDVWIAPRRETRTAGTSRVRNRYGTSLRVFDFATKVWTVYWFNPVTGAQDRLVAAKQGNDIVQSGTDAEGNLMRWVFTEITEDSFRWYGERSMDGGRSWTLEAEFFGTRL